MVCPNCGFNNPEGVINCLKCGGFMSQPTKKNKNGLNGLQKGIILGFLGLIIVLLIVLLVKPGEYGSKDAEILDKGTRTILIYMIGSNLESEHGCATLDLNEMFASKFNQEDVNILIYTGGAKNWRNDVINSSENAIYQLKGDDLVKVKSFTKKSMVEEDTLVEFINYAYDNYKTDLYDLLLWDHGGGPIVGYGIDENFAGSFTMGKFNRALDSTNLFKDNIKFELIGFDACLMGSAEVGNLLKEEANYLIGSEETEPGAGWDYSFLTNINRNTTSIEFGKAIVDSYYNYYENSNQSSFWGATNYITLSFLDLSKMDALMEMLNNGFSGLATNVSIDYYSTVNEGINKSTIYGCNPNQCLDLVDLKTLISNPYLKVANVENINKAIDDVVVYEKNNIDGSTGLTVYFPAKSKSVVELNLSKYAKLGFAENYVKFLNSYASIMNTSKKVGSLSFDSDTKNNYLAVELPEDMALDYLDSYVSIYENGSNMIYHGINSGINGYILSSTQPDSFISINVNNEKYTVPAYEYLITDTKSTYMVLLRLKNGDLSNDVYFYVEFEKDSKEGKVVDIRKADTEDVISKSVYNSNEWNILDVLSLQGISYNEDSLNRAVQKEIDLTSSKVSFTLEKFDSSKSYDYVYTVITNDGEKHILDKISMKP